jgi:hypothetical protein
LWRDQGMAPRIIPSPTIISGAATAVSGSGTKVSRFQLERTLTQSTHRSQVSGIFHAGSSAKTNIVEDVARELEHGRNDYLVPAFFSMDTDFRDAHNERQAPIVPC